MSAAYLPEIPEKGATGTVAAVYDEIRRAIGIPLVNLVYRHLAVSPGRLESIWTELKPNLLHRQTAQGAERLASTAVPANVVRVPPPALAAIGVDQKELNRARETVDVYMRANPRNLLVLSCLLYPSEARKGEPPEQVTVPEVSRMATLPPMIDLKGVAARDPRFAERNECADRRARRSPSRPEPVPTFCIQSRAARPPMDGASTRGS